jgi:sulfate adenylyltransferase (ADP) / ATP adenylyltransferase
LIHEVKNCSHILVLNKYPVIPNHFIVATKANKPQTGLLEQDDLAVTYACVQAWRAEFGNDQDDQLFAFFNSGEHSGASQPHRHLQLLPIKDMKINASKWQDPETFDWSPLLLSMTSNYHEEGFISYRSNSRLPIWHAAFELHDETPATLHSKYMQLLTVALKATKEPSATPAPHSGEQHLVKEGKTTISYNLAITSNVMAILPRQSGDTAIPGLDPSHSVSINGTILGGTLMVKEQVEWDQLRQATHSLDPILEAIGYPTTFSAGTRITILPTKTAHDSSL